MRRSCFGISVLLILSACVVAAQTQGAQNFPLTDAAQLISAGKLDQAEVQLHRVLRSKPEDVRALDLLGVIRVLQHQESTAQDLFTRVVKKEPNFAPGRAHLGLLDLQMGRLDEAVPHLREAVRFDPSRSDARSALVHILQSQSQSAVDAGNFGKALTLLNEVRADAPDDADLHFEFGMVALHLSLLKDAADAFEKTLQLRDDYALAHYNLGRAWMGLSKFDEARLQFSDYIKLRPDDPSGHCALGMTLAALERMEEARAEFERSLQIQPTQAESYYRFGLLELESGNLEAASRRLREVLNREPDHAPALTALGRVSFMQKHYEEARSTLQRATDLDASIREAHYYLGLTLARMSHKSEAEQQFEIATQLEREETDRRRTLLILSPGLAAAPQP